MCLALPLLVITHRSGQSVGKPQPSSETDVEQDSSYQHHLEHLDNIIRAHKVAKSSVPCTVVMTQYAQVGTGMEQQED